MSVADNIVIGALEPGTRLHEYEIQGVLGHGGFGITYLARDLNLDKTVAIKEFLPVDLAQRIADGTISVRSPEMREAYDWGRGHFLMEARVLARFHHPHLVQVHRFFEASGTAYIVMSYAQGEPLDRLLRREKTLDEAVLREVLLPLLDGLEEVHNAGILHRDIKPGNIVLRPVGGPVLIDFGAARLDLSSRTRSLMSALTAGYAPIEQYAAADDQGPWSDLYALGAVAYRALAGRRPIEAVVRVRDDPMVPASVLGQGRYSAPFLAAIDWALAVHPTDRPRSAGEWRLALLGEHPAPAPTPASQSPPPADAAELEPTEIRAPIAQASAEKSVLEATQVLPKASSGDGTAAPPLRARAVRWRAAGVAALIALVMLLAVLLAPPSQPPPPVQSAPAPASEPVADTEPVIDAEPEASAPQETEVSTPAAITVSEQEPAKVASVPSGKTAPETQAQSPDKTAERTLEPPASTAQTRSTPPPTPVPAPIATPPKTTVAAPAKLSIARMKPLSTFGDCSVCPLMVVLPPGQFSMGAPRSESGANAWEQPARKVRLGKAFAIGRFEITAAQWQACVEANACPAHGDTGKGPLPAVNVNLFDARAYTGWLSRVSGRNYRLPTEAEWEYAARAGTTSSRYWGATREGQCLHANAADRSAKRLLERGAELAECDDRFAGRAPVGRLRANAFGLHDMAGNVWEFTEDCWRDSYKGAPSDGRAVLPDDCRRHVIRGGSWRSKPESLRSAARGLTDPDLRSADLGFRVAAE